MGKWEAGPTGAEDDNCFHHCVWFRCVSACSAVRDVLFGPMWFDRKKYCYSIKLV